MTCLELLSQINFILLLIAPLVLIGALAYILFGPQTDDDWHTFPLPPDMQRYSAKHGKRRNRTQRRGEEHAEATAGTAPSTVQPPSEPHPQEQAGQARSAQAPQG